MTKPWNHNNNLGLEPNRVWKHGRTSRMHGRVSMHQADNIVSTFEGDWHKLGICKDVRNVNREKSRLLNSYNDYVTGGYRYGRTN